MGINFVKQFVSAGLSQSIKLIGPGFSADEDVIQAVGEPMLGMVSTAQWARPGRAAEQGLRRSLPQGIQRPLSSVYAAQAYDVIMAMDAAVSSRRQGQRSRRHRARAGKGRLPLGARQLHLWQEPLSHPAYYQRVIQKDASGRITNKLVGKVFDKYQDVYVGECK